MSAPAPGRAPAELLLAAPLCLLALAFAWADIRLVHPGAAWPDELKTLAMLQEWREGLAGLPFSFFKGSLQRAAVAMAPGHLHGPVFAAFLAESAALYVLGRRIFGERAAAWALAVNAASAFTLLRLRSLLSYSIAPAELLLLLALLPYCRRNKMTALAWGAAGGLMVLDYEAWGLGIFILAFAALNWFPVAAAHASPNGNGRAETAGHAPPLQTPLIFLGILLALGFVAWISKNEFADYLTQRLRGAGSGGFGLGLRELAFGGASAHTSMGVANWPFFPFWLWPALLGGAAAAWRAGRWVLGWAALGLLPALYLNSGTEPQRLIMAWPALCLLAGLGLERFASRRRRALPLLALAFSAGALFEARACLRSMDAGYEFSYGHSSQLLALGPELRASRLLTELDNEGAGASRLLLAEGGFRPVPGAPVAALVPWDYAWGLEKQGRLEIFRSRPGAVPLCVFWPGPKALARLEAVDAELGALHRSLPRFRPAAARAAAVRHLMENPGADIWVRSACWELVLGNSFLLGEFPAAALRSMEKEPLQSAAGLLWAAEKLDGADAAWAARLRRKAARIDPRLGP
jgi:hypothetical protein